MSVKSNAIRKPEAGIQVKLFGNHLESLIQQKQYDPTNTLRIGKDAILVINALIWEKLELMYHSDRNQFFKHYNDGEDFHLTTNSCQITRRLFFLELKLATAKTGENAFDSDHPTFRSFRSRWYVNIYRFLVDTGYIKQKTNFKVGNIVEIDEKGRGNFVLTINVKDFLFGLDSQINEDTELGFAVSDTEGDDMPTDGDVFLCPDIPLEKLYPTVLNIEIKIKETESGAVSPQSSVSVEMSQKEKRTHKQGKPTFGESGGENVKISENSQKTTENNENIVNYATRLSDFYSENILKPEYFEGNQIRFSTKYPCNSYKIRDFRPQFIDLLRITKQSDEDSFEFAYDRLLFAMTGMAKRLETSTDNWVYFPKSYLSVEKVGDSDKYRFTMGSLRAYHDQYLIANRGRISPDLTEDIRELFLTFYPKMKEFGVSDKFLTEWKAKLGDEAIFAEVKRAFAKLAGGFIPKNKGNYIRKCIMDSQTRIAKERAELEAKKTIVKRGAVDAVAPNATPSVSTISKPEFGEFIRMKFPTDCNLLKNNHLHTLYVNFKSLERLEIDVRNMIESIKQNAHNQTVMAKLFAEKPELLDEVKRLYRLKKRTSLNYSESESDFIESHLKLAFPNYFKQSNSL